MTIILDEYDMRKLPARERLDKITEIIKFDKKDESKRWDAVWLAGEICEKTSKFKQEIADLMVWVLDYDDSGVVKHEAAFQIGLRNMRDRIPRLIDCAVHDKSDLARHESIEALGMLRDQSADTKKVLEALTYVDSKAVSETAKFVLKRLNRLKYKGAYRDGEPI